MLSPFISGPAYVLFIVLVIVIFSSAFYLLHGRYDFGVVHFKELTLIDMTAMCSRSRMSFPGQKEFEDSLRVLFYELWEITQDCAEILARINVPGDAGLAAPLLGPAPSVISDTEMPDGDDSDEIDQPAIAKSDNVDPL